MEDQGAHRERLEEVKAQRDRLFEQIGKAWGSEDISLTDIKPDSTAKIGCTIAPKVAVAPVDTLGQWLIEHLLSNGDPQKWGGQSATESQPLHNSRRSSKVSSDVQVPG